MKNIIKTKTFFVFLVCTSIFICMSMKCQEQINTESSINLKLLYIEDTDGKHGLGMGNFGDVVLYDLSESKKRNITNDKFFDEYPSYSRMLNRVYFSSLRDDLTHRITGINSNSHIYYSDLQSMEIVRVDDAEFYSKFKINKFRNSNNPTISSSGRFLSFTCMLDDYSTGIGVYDLKVDSILGIVRDLYLPTNLVWDNSDERLIFESSFDKKFPQTTNYIGQINIKNKSLEQLLSRKNELLYPLDIANNFLLFYKFLYDEDSYSLEVLNLDSKETVYLIELSDLGFDEINSAKYLNENEIVFIGIKEIDADYPICNIYTLELKSEVLTQLTDDGHMRNFISVIK